MTDEELAAAFHTAYETLAPKYGYQTREDSRVAWADVPQQNKLLMIATAGLVKEALYRSVLQRELVSLGEVKNGDVIVVRYLKDGLPDQEERRKDYRSIRDYFQIVGLSIRLLGISSEMTLEKTNELEMAQFGWYKKR